MKWSYIILGYAALFLIGLFDNVRGPFFPQILLDFNVSDEVGSYFFSVCSLVSLLVGFLATYKISKIAPVYLLRFSLIAFIILSCVYYWANNFSILLISAVIFGVISAINGLGQNIIVQQGSSPDKLRQSLSGLHSMYALSSLIAPLLAGYLFKNQIPWREGFLFLIIPSFLILLFSLKVKPIQQYKSQNLKTQNPFLFVQILASLCVGFSVIAELSISTRLPLYLQRNFSYKPEEAAYMLTYFFIFMLLGRTFITLVKIKMSHYKLLIYFSILSILFLVLGLQCHPIFLCVFGISIAPFFPVGLAWMGELFADYFQNSTAILMIVTSLSVAFMHWSVGKISDLYGIELALYIGIPCLIINIFLILFTEKYSKTRTNP